jgi:ammonium transporter Rh
MEKVEIDMEMKDGEKSVMTAVGKSMSKATWLLGGFQLLLLILMATATQGPDNTTSPGTVTQAYNMFIGVEIMMFIGFGYLMTFLKLYGLGAVGFCMVVTAMALQFAVFTEAFWTQVWDNEYHLVSFNMYSLLGSLYTVSAVLITFGAVIGKITPVQLIFVAIIELFLHSFNYKVLMTGVMKFQDMGGTYIDHMFGAYFGLAVSYMLGKPRADSKVYDGGQIPDLFSLLGTLFLWIYWPSFVAGGADANSDEQSRALVNTILSLSGSTVAAFFLSSVLGKDGKFRPVDIQNATLAGGVAVGSIANLMIGPFDAVVTGIVAGLVSTYGFSVIQPYLEEKWDLHDTCGIHNLHALPSIIGALASVVVQAYKGNQESTDPRQWWFQLVAMFICLAYSIVTGLVTGFIIKLLDPVTSEDIEAFRDDSWWEVAEDFGADVDITSQNFKKMEMSASKTSSNSLASAA